MVKKIKIGMDMVSTMKKGVETLHSINWTMNMACPCLRGDLKGIHVSMSHNEIDTTQTTKHQRVLTK